MRYDITENLCHLFNKNHRKKFEMVPNYNPWLEHIFSGIFAYLAYLAFAYLNQCHKSNISLWQRWPPMASNTPGFAGPSRGCQSNNKVVPVLCQCKSLSQPATWSNTLTTLVLWFWSYIIACMQPYLKYQNAIRRISLPLLQPVRELTYSASTKSSCDC